MLSQPLQAFLMEFQEQIIFCFLRCLCWQQRCNMKIPTLPLTQFTMSRSELTNVCAASDTKLWSSKCWGWKFLCLCQISPYWRRDGIWDKHGNFQPLEMQCNNHAFCDIKLRTTFQLQTAGSPLQMLIWQGQFCLPFRCVWVLSPRNT